MAAKKKKYNITARQHVKARGLAALKLRKVSNKVTLIG